MESDDFSSVTWTASGPQARVNQPAPPAPPMPANPAPIAPPQHQSQIPTQSPVPQTSTVPTTQPVTGQHQANYPTDVFHQQVLPSENNNTDLIEKL